MTENKKIEPTDAMVGIVELAEKLMVLDVRTALRLALNHPDAAGLFEADHTDCAHVDEAARRVEAAREQGWDDAVQWVKDELPGIQWAANALNSANPYRPARVEHVRLKGEFGTVIEDVIFHDERFSMPPSGYEVQMVWAGDAWTHCGRHMHTEFIAACTLGGDRLVRDGEFEDGTPRFRKEGRA